jgi:glycine betaine/proline transport system substrate-binding protein
MRIAKYYALSFLQILAVGIAVAPARSAEVVIGRAETPFGDAIDAVTKAIIEDRLGVPARTETMSGAVAFKAMAANRGAVDISGGQLPTVQSLVDEYVTREHAVILAPHYWGAKQGICTPTSAARKYNIKSVYDILRPEIVHLTVTGNDVKGNFWIGETGWASTLIDHVRARFYGLDQLYHLVESQDFTEYALVRNAIKTGSAIFYACDGASNFIFPKGSITMLDEPPYDPKKWHIVMPSQSPDWYQKSDIETSWPPLQQHFVYAKHLQTDLPEVAHLIDGMNPTFDEVHAWTYATFTERQNLNEYAKEWVKNNPTIVNSWLGQ